MTHIYYQVAMCACITHNTRLDFVGSLQELEPLIHQIVDLKLVPVCTHKMDAACDDRDGPCICSQASLSFPIVWFGTYM